MTDQKPQGPLSRRLPQPQPPRREPEWVRRAREERERKGFVAVKVIA